MDDVAKTTWTKYGQPLLRTLNRGLSIKKPSQNSDGSFFCSVM
jgi:hypothetical protein